MLTILALLLVAWLPGAALFRAPWADRERRAALAADERLFWCVLLSVAWSCAAGLALASLGIYYFSFLLSANLLLALVVGLGSRGDLRLRGASRPGFAAIVPLALVLVGLWLYFPPAEYVMGGKDPGTYMNEGIQIAQRGTWAVDDPVVASVPKTFRDLFFPSHANPTYYSLRFMGFFIQDPDRGTVIGQFPHLYPVSIAIAYGLHGLSGARQVVGAWTILGLLATYFLGARLFGRTAAAAGTTLLAINVITVWFARYPNAEVVMLALLGAALLAAARAVVDGDRFFATVAGTLLGLLLFLRFDAVLAIGGVIGGLMLARFDGRRIAPVFWVTLLPLLGLAAWYLVGPMKAYFAYPVVFTQNLQVTLVAIVAALALGAYAWAVRRPALAARVRRALPAAYVMVLVALAAYAYFVRQPAGRTALHDAMAFRSFAWYVTAPGLALAVAGLAIVAMTRFWRDPTFFSTLAVFAGFFFYKIRIVPQHFWMTRRFLPVILPAATLTMAAAAAWLAAPDGIRAWSGGRGGRAADGDGDLVTGTRMPEPASAHDAEIPVAPVAARPVSTARTAHPLHPLLQRTLQAVAAVIVLLVGWAFWDASRPILRHVEYAGLIPRLEELASRFGDNDLVIVESRSASDAHVLALPLAYIYARQVLVLNTPRPDKVAFAGFLDWARQHYRDVYFLGGGGTDLLSRRIGVEAVAGDRFQVPEYDSPVNAYPAGVRRKEFDYSISRFVPARSPDGRFVLDVGTNDDLLVVRFYAKERQPQTGMSFRWTRDSSYVSVLGMQPDTRTVTAWMGDGGRPATATPAVVTVSLDDRPLGAVTLTHDVRPYAFEVPADVAAAAAGREEPARLRFTTSTWQPKALLGVADDRQLGVVVDRVEAR